ncbi:hypothetical protein CEP51_013900 [Fusarium floridanum]|uniref:Uncharacterized protein n=1 Tax=Fusarium floridanum TaxID=1325733 RepID=A0A428Q2J2_9HYPO|nr:hypothetical protein CEP51_013900 [Fusarium floridanum]
MAHVFLPSHPLRGVVRSSPFSVGVYCADDATGNNTDGEMMGLVLSLNSVASGVNTPLLLSQNNVSDNFICVSDVIETVIVEW